MEKVEDKKSNENIYHKMTDEHVKKLAEDMYKGLVFTNRHIDRQEDVPRVFMPLLIIEDEIRDKLLQDPPGMIYEYMDRAGPMAINGMPMFLSLQMVSIDDTKRVIECLNKIKCAIENI